MMVGMPRRYSARHRRHGYSRQSIGAYFLLSLSSAAAVAAAAASASSAVGAPLLLSVKDSTGTSW